MKTISLIIGSVMLVCLTACDNEEGKIYTSRDPDECKTLLFTCAPDREPFFDDEGCGCEWNEDRADINRDIDRDTRDNKNENPIPTSDDTYDRDPGERDSTGDEGSEQRFDKDPIDRNLEDLQDRRLQE